jgi:hypothetical protein
MTTAKSSRATPPPRFSSLPPPSTSLTKEMSAPNFVGTPFSTPTSSPFHYPFPTPLPSPSPHHPIDSSPPFGLSTAKQRHLAAVILGHSRSNRRQRVAYIDKNIAPPRSASVDFSQKRPPMSPAPGSSSSISTSSDDSELDYQRDARVLGSGLQLRTSGSDTSRSPHDVQEDDPIKDVRISTLRPSRRGLTSFVPTGPNL